MNNTERAEQKVKEAQERLDEAMKLLEKTTHPAGTFFPQEVRICYSGALQDIFKDEESYLPVFKTQRKAEKANNRAWAEQVILYEIANFNKDNGNWTPDWEDVGQAKVCISLNKYDARYETQSTHSTQFHGNEFYFSGGDHSELLKLLMAYPYKETTLNILDIWFKGEE